MSTDPLLAATEGLRLRLDFTTRRFVQQEAAMRLTLSLISSSVLLRWLQLLHETGVQRLQSVEQPWLAVLLFLLTFGLNDPCYGLRLLLNGSQLLATGALVGRSRIHVDQCAAMAQPHLARSAFLCRAM